MNHWIWQPHAGHFICSQWCQFRMNTVVGTTVKWIVSTVGEFLPSPDVQTILAESRGITLKGHGDAREADFLKKIGYTTIGSDRLYETMVFLAKPLTPESCCAYEMASGRDVDFSPYNAPLAARQGHMLLCNKWHFITELPRDTEP